MIWTGVVIKTSSIDELERREDLLADLPGEGADVDPGRRLELHQDQAQDLLIDQGATHVARQVVGGVPVTPPEVLHDLASLRGHQRAPLIRVRLIQSVCASVTRSPCSSTTYQSRHSRSLRPSTTASAGFAWRDCVTNRPSSQS